MAATKLMEEDTDVPCLMKLSKISFWEMLTQLVFDSKLKINLYHEHFPDTLEKYTRFPKFNLLFRISYVRVNGKSISN